MIGIQRPGDQWNDLNCLQARGKPLIQNTQDFNVSHWQYLAQEAERNKPFPLQRVDNILHKNNCQGKIKALPASKNSSLYSPIWPLQCMGNLRNGDAISQDKLLVIRWCFIGIDQISQTRRCAACYHGDVPWLRWTTIVTLKIQG